MELDAGEKEIIHFVDQMFGRIMRNARATLLKQLLNKYRRGREEHGDFDFVNAEVDADALIRKEIHNEVLDILNYHCIDRAIERVKNANRQKIDKEIE